MQLLQGKNAILEWFTTINNDYICSKNILKIINALSRSAIIMY